MVSLTALWLPILLSAVVVFLASSVLHMVLKFHHKDYQKLPDERAIQAAMRETGVGPGNYAFPCPDDPSDWHSPEMVEKFKEGPVGFMNVRPNGAPAMGKYLATWFGFCVLIAIFCAYVASRTLAAGTEYLLVFQITGTVAFVAYGVSSLTESIWRAQRWSTTFRFVIDGLVYSLLTGGVFGWLWP
jgi:Flp pilus assembly protein TadB